MKKSTWLAIIVVDLLIINAFLYIFTEIKNAAVLYKWISSFLAVACSLIASIGLLIAYRGFKKSDLIKISWLALFIGMVLFFAGETIYAALDLVLKLNPEQNFPTIADFSWFLGYIPLCVGLIILVNSYKKSGFSTGSGKFYGWFAAVMTAALIAIIYFLCIPIAKDKETTFLAKFMYMFYPIVDLFIITISVILMYLTGLFGKGFVSRPWKCMAFGFLFITVADIAYSYINITWPGLYEAGNVIDIGWNAGYLLIGLAGFYQKELVDSIGNKAKS